LNRAALEAIRKAVFPLGQSPDEEVEEDLMVGWHFGPDTPSWALSYYVRLVAERRLSAASRLGLVADPPDDLVE
jgi:hypothetical protein